MSKSVELLNACKNISDSVAKDPKQVRLIMKATKHLKADGPPFQRAEFAVWVRQTWNTRPDDLPDIDFETFFAIYAMGYRAGSAQEKALWDQALDELVDD